MLKRIGALLLSCLLVLSLAVLPTQAATDAEFVVAADKTAAFCGETVTVTVSLSKPLTTDTTGIILEYDETALEYVGGEFIAPSVLSGVNGATPGVVTCYSKSLPTDISGEPIFIADVVYVLKFRVKTSADTKTTLVSVRPQVDGKELAANDLTLVLNHTHSYSSKSDISCDLCGFERLFYRVAADKPSAANGETVTVTVSISTPLTTNQTGLLLEYDATALEYVDGEFTGEADGLTGVDTPQPGVVACFSKSFPASAGGGPISVSGVVYQLRFRVKTSVQTETTLVATDPKADDYALAVNDLTLTLNCAHTYGQWTVTTEPSWHRPGQKTATCSTCGATKTEIIPATGGGQYLPGDVDGDGDKDTDDAVYLLLHVMFGREYYPTAYDFPDFNGSGEVTTDDAVYLLLHVMFGEEYYPLQTG